MIKQENVYQEISRVIDIKSIEKRAFIDGKYVEAIKKKVIIKISSIDGRDLTGLSACDEEDIEIAVGAAKRAYNQGIWSEVEPAERKKVMLKLADLMEEHRQELAILDTIETGRSFKNYYYDSIPKAIEALRYFAESVDKYYDAAISPRKNSFSVITREPLGVVGVITPWNDPLVVAMWKIAPALLMGNSVVVKPAEQSSFSILKVAQLAQQAGLPDGVLNIVTGYGEIAGKALALHKDVRGIFFTGSSEVGKKIMGYASISNMKRVGLECGGKSPFIITRNCKQLDKAAAVLAKNIFYNQGQICSAPSRVIVDRSVRNEVLEYLKKECEKYVPSNPLSINSEVGCVVSQSQHEKIKKYIRIGIEEGGEYYEAKTRNQMPEGACYIQPCIFTNITPKSTLYKEEIFGPVLVMVEYENIEEAIRLANDTEYGLAGAIWTNDIDEAYQVARKMEAGIIHINSYGDDDNTAPFGGIKQSGIGKDKSMYAFDEYSVSKTTWMHFNDL